MKEMFFNWLSGLGVDVTPMMALVIALGFIVLTAMVLHLVLHRILLVRLVGLLGKTKQMWLPPQLQQRLFYRLAFVFQGPCCSVRRRSGCPKRPTACAYRDAGPALDPAVPAAGPVRPARLHAVGEPLYPARADLPLRGIFQG
jgi:miniconductance mechanosensitive channel